MRQHSRDGRVAAQRAEGALPATAPPDQSDFLQRLRLAFESFGRSFDREEEIASHISSIADLMASRSRFLEIEDGLSPHADRVGLLDLERGADIQQRTTLVQTVTPPT
jgi:alkanesulfonate monooxygenase SsuD/methylene tetrahydromethanopterin reductase-like flavin-dependent oxidoreductase (luciferase family)